ncbi:MAG: hypothetical protein A3F09_06030 [Chlamydiae bacterium RIFCSPHIGHO2_12_FULL_49_11]|nr:MAG: hypothetical protein A3F09_06030 [Chlamydiae bacterium RIFCSPHIGHO2_12_FULL_49_11]
MIPRKFGFLCFFCTSCFYGTPIFKIALPYFYYCADKPLSPAIAENRLRFLQEKFHAEIPEDSPPAADFLFIPSSAIRPPDKRQGILLFCLNHPLLRFHYKYWSNYLDAGADIILWNPKNGIQNPKNYAAVLKTILEYTRAHYPQAAICLHSHCASSDPAIAAVSEKCDPDIHLIIDRGHGDISSLVRSFPLVGYFIGEGNLDDYDCHGIHKIGTIPGKILSLVAMHDQVMNSESGNLTRRLSERCPHQEMHEMITGDHWSYYDEETYLVMCRFMVDLGILLHIPPYPGPSTSSSSCQVQNLARVILH